MSKLYKKTIQQFILTNKSQKRFGIKITHFIKIINFVLNCLTLEKC